MAGRGHSAWRAGTASLRSHRSQLENNPACSHGRGRGSALEDGAFCMPAGWREGVAEDWEDENDKMFLRRDMLGSDLGTMLFQSMKTLAFVFTQVLSWSGTNLHLWALKLLLFALVCTAAAHANGWRVKQSRSEKWPFLISGRQAERQQQITVGFVWETSRSVCLSMLKKGLLGFDLAWFSWYFCKKQFEN